MRLGPKLGFVATGDDRGPRPVRSTSHLWGLEALSLRELEQVLMGNELLQFSLDMMLRLYFSDGFGVVEHPDEPQDEDKPSIWKLPVLDLFRAIENFHEIRFGQGLLGAASPKPTRLLVLNLPGLRTTLRRHRSFKRPPKEFIDRKAARWHVEDGVLKGVPARYE